MDQSDRPPSESCNGVDDDCDGEVPRSELDLDGDGLRPCDEDCNDHDDSVGRCDCLAVGGGGYEIRVYRLDGLGGLSVIWSSDEVSTTRGLTWVDWDGDGDEDLAAGNESDRNRIYRRTETGFELAWESDHIDDTMSMAWADWDSDGDMDLVVGNYYNPNRLFQNNDGVLDEVWTFGDTRLTAAVVWGDVDSDSDLDLVEANHHSVRVYEANLGEFTELWSTTDHDDVTTAALGHLDSEAHPRLFVGTQTGLFSYRREGETYVLTSTNVDVTWSQALALGDRNFDGDADLAIAASHEQTDRILEKDGDLFTQTWAAFVVEDSFSVAWVDFDRDGVLDLSFDDTLYRGSREGGFDVAWTPDQWNNTRSIAWGLCGDEFGD